MFEKIKRSENSEAKAKIKSKSKKTGFIKRLLNESLILSCLGKLSSRLISFLKVSILSFLLTGCSKADSALETGVVGTYLKKPDIRGRVIRPVKRGFARSAEESILVQSWNRTGKLSLQSWLSCI